MGRALAFGLTAALAYFDARAFADVFLQTGEIVVALLIALVLLTLLGFGLQAVRRNPASNWSLAVFGVLFVIWMTPGMIEVYESREWLTWQMLPPLAVLGVAFYYAQRWWYGTRHGYQPPTPEERRAAVKAEAARQRSQPTSRRRKRRRDRPGSR